MNLIKTDKRTIDAIYLHCTATSPGVPVSVEAIRRYHVDVRGFSDIGYHYVVQPNGERCSGRLIDRKGAHVLGDNDHSIGVCMVGNWDEAIPTRDDPQIWATGELIAKLCVLYDIPPDPWTVILHRDAHKQRVMVPNPHKSCPGANIESKQFVQYIQWHWSRMCEEVSP